MRVRMMGTLLLLGTPPATVELAAQHEPVLTVQVDSPDPLSSLPVSRSSGDIRVPPGTARPGGAPFALNMRALNTGMGMRVGANVQREEIILAEGGTVDRQRQPQVTNHRRRATIALELAKPWYNQLESVACDEAAISGLTGCTARNGGIGFGAFAEYLLFSRFAIGTRYFFSDYSVDQQFGTVPGRHLVSVRALDFYTRYELPLGGPFYPFAIFGGSWYDNEDEAWYDDELWEVRSQSGFRKLGGLGIRFDILRNVDLRATVRLATAGDSDADTNFGAGLSAGLRF